MRTRRWLVGLLCGCLSLGLLLPVTARADEAPAQPTARDLLTRASQARGRGDLEGALELLLQAYEREAAPVLLNNIARLYEDLGRYGEAFTAYKTVLDDPKAPENLRAMDAARMAILGTRLGKAWIRPRLEPGEARLWIDGDIVPSNAESEIPVPHGPHLYQGLTRGGDVVWITELQFPLDRRSDLSISLLNPGTAMATVSLPPTEAPLVGLQIDGHLIQGDPSLLRRLHLSPGEHTLLLDHGSHGKSRRRGFLKGGTTVSVTTLSIVPSETATPPREETQTEQKSAAVVTPEARSPLPLVTAGIGTIAAGIGGALLAEAAKNREAPVQNTSGVIVGLSQVDDAKRWSEANTLSRRGAIALGVGGTLVVGGVVWWIVADDTDDDDDALTVAPGLGGLVLGGTF